MKRLILILVFLIIVLGGTTFYFYRSSKLSLNQKLANSNEVKSLVEQVGKLVFLPKGEVPTVATVTDLEPLKGKPFFEDAKKGDKVLIFNDAKKAILFDPVANKIINIAPVNSSVSGNTSAEPTLQINPAPEAIP
jgi:hypothetical protein